MVTEVSQHLKHEGSSMLVSLVYQVVEKKLSACFTHSSSRQVHWCPVNDKMKSENLIPKCNLQDSNQVYSS